MQAYLTWDTTGEHLWLTTPYKDKKQNIWKAEHTTPFNKIKVKRNTLEFYCWEAINTPYASGVYKLNKKELDEVLNYAIT